MRTTPYLYLLLLLLLNYLHTQSSSVLQSSKLPLCIGVLTIKNDTDLSRSIESYIKTNLFSLVEQTVIFFQQVDSPDRVARTHSLLAKYPLFHTAIFEPKNIVFASFLRIANACTSKYILILEEDFVIRVSASKVREQLHLAVALLESNAASIVWMRNRFNMGFPNYGFHAYLKYGDLPKNLRLFYLSFNESAAEFAKDYYKCHAKPITYCTTTEFAAFVNTPTIYSRDNLLTWLAKLQPKRMYQLNKFEKFMTDVIAEHNYTVAWSSGLFTHQADSRARNNGGSDVGEEEGAMEHFKLDYPPGYRPAP